MKIFIAAGHGGNDPGSSAGSEVEREELIKLVDAAVAIIKPIIKPTKELVVVPHELCLTEEVKYINDNSIHPEEDICIEVHLNNNSGDPGTGIETYYGYKKLADTMQKSMVAVLGLKDRGVKEGNWLYFNKNTKPYSALVEAGFINNPVDLEKVRRLGALALASGIAAYCGIEMATVTVQTQPQEDWKMRCLVAERKLENIKESIKLLFVQI